MFGQKKTKSTPHFYSWVDIVMIINFTAVGKISCLVLM